MKPKGPVQIWLLNYFTHIPEPSELYVLDGAWFIGKSDKAGLVTSFDIVREMVFLTEEEGLRAGIARWEVEMGAKARAMQDNVQIMKDKLDNMSGDSV